MTDASLGFAHRYIPAARSGLPTLLLLHGTGGDENDLLPLGQMLLPGAALLSPRGNVLEYGMPRFFRRFPDGRFDVEDLRKRTDELAEFVSSAAAHYNFAPGNVVAAGYSNGANIGASLLLLRPQTLAGAVLFHALLPLDPDQPPDLAGVGVFISGGRADTMIDPARTGQLEEMLTAAGADVTMHWEPGGHQLTRAEIEAARRWLAAHFVA